MELVKTFIDEKGREIEVYHLKESSIRTIHDFYHGEIKKLEDKANFYPYKDHEIEKILKGHGIFVGGFFEGELIALCAIDFDKKYQKEVKRVNVNYPAFPKHRELLEFSGLFVKSDFRKACIAENMIKILIDYAKVDAKSLMAVIQVTNIPSLKSFFSYGFVMYGHYKLDDIFTFTYLVYEGKEWTENMAKETILVSKEELKAKMKEGYAFIGYEDNLYIGCKVK